MKNIIYILLAGLILTISCEKEDEQEKDIEENQPGDTTINENLIKNPNFEENGDFTYDHWLPVDTFYLDCSEETPDDNEKWSLKLIGGSTQGNLIENYIDTYVIADSSGLQQYNLEAWMKNNTDKAIGSIHIGILNNNNITQDSLITSQPIETWEKYTVHKSLDVQPGDTIIIRLKTGGSPVASYYTLFDKLSLKYQKE
jgi:hypothetical protein